MLKILREVALLIVLMFITSQIVYSQNDEVFLFIDSTTIIGKISDNQVFTSETNIAYTLQGNTIYAGDTATKQQLLFLVNAKDILSNKTGLVYQNDAKTIQYITRKSSFFLGDHPIDEDNERLLTFEQVNDSITTVYNGITGKAIGFITGKLNKQVIIVVAAHAYIKHYHLDEEVQQIVQQLQPDTLFTGEAIMRPLLEHSLYYEWVWDGKTLKPLWGYRPEDEWTFDGKYLKPAWSSDPQSEWVWDGSTLKPFWESGVEQQWVWIDNTLKPFWDSNPDLMWKLEDGIMRPMWNFDMTKQWVVEGQIPLPIVALIVMGKADR